MSEWRYDHSKKWIADDRGVVAYMPAGKGEDFAEKNGPVIAAAWETLAALKAIMVHVDKTSEYIGDTGLDDAARAAIAKAEGRT